MMLICQEQDNLLCFPPGVKMAEMLWVNRPNLATYITEPSNDMSLLKMQVKWDRLVNNKWMPGLEDPHIYGSITQHLEKSIMEACNYTVPKGKPE